MLRPAARKYQILLMIADGARNLEIAEELNLCDSTIKHEVTELMKTYGAKNRANLVALAYQQGILVTK